MHGLYQQIRSSRLVTSVLNKRRAAFVYAGKQPGLVRVGVVPNRDWSGWVCYQAGRRPLVRVGGGHLAEA